MRIQCRVDTGHSYIDVEITEYNYATKKIFKSNPHQMSYKWLFFFYFLKKKKDDIYCVFVGNFNILNCMRTFGLRCRNFFRTLKCYFPAWPYATICITYLESFFFQFPSSKSSIIIHTFQANFIKIKNKKRPRSCSLSYSSFVYCFSII